MSTQVQAKKSFINLYIEYTDTTESIELFRKWTAISTIAAALQRKVVLPMGHLEIYPNLYIVLIGPPGRSRKGTAMGPAEKIMKSIGIKTAPQSITREAFLEFMADSREPLATVDQDLGEDTLNIPETGGKFHSSVTVYAKELVVFLGHKNSVFLADIVDLFDADAHEEWEYKTKTSGTSLIYGPWLNLLGATTPDLLQSSLPKESTGGGFTSRIIFVHNSEFPTPEPFPMKDKKIEVMLKEDLERIFLLSGEFKITEGWAKTYSDWRFEEARYDPFNDERLSHYLNRRPLHLLKLCMVFSAAEGSNMIITESHFNQALEALREVEKSMKYAFGGFGKSDDYEAIHKIAEVLYSARTGKTFKPQEMRDVYRRVQADIGQWERFELCIDSLLQAGVIKKKLNLTDNKEYLTYVSD